jgi:hypothetical protein
MNATRKAQFWLVAALLTAAAGCATAGRHSVTYHDPNMDFSLVQTVAVTPFANLTPSNNAADRVRDVFMTMLQATGSIYVLPPGEVARGLSRANVASSTTPTAEDVVALGKIVKADVIITGTVLEYGEVRSGSAVANVVSVELKMMEVQAGRVVWSASSSKGGITAADRLFGSGGRPMNAVTQEAVKDLLDKLFGK